MGFPTKNDHFGVCFLGYRHFRKPRKRDKQSRQAARLPCLWAGLPGLKWKPFFFGANCGHKETKNIFKKKQSHVGNLYSKHPSMMYFPTFAINEIYKDQANVYRYSKYTRPMDGNAWCRYFFWVMLTHSGGCLKKRIDS